MVKRMGMLFENYSSDHPLLPLAFFHIRDSWFDLLKNLKAQINPVPEGKLTWFYIFLKVSLLSTICHFTEKEKYFLFKWRVLGKCSCENSSFLYFAPCIENILGAITTLQPIKCFFPCKSDAVITWEKET